MIFLAQGFTVSADAVLKTVSGIFLTALVAGGIYIARKWPLLEQAFTRDFPAALSALSNQMNEIRHDLNVVDGKVDGLSQQMVERRVRSEDIERRLLKVETRVEGMLDRRGPTSTS